MDESETPPRALTLDEAVRFGILLQKNDQPSEAHELYRRVLEIDPHHPAALHYAGVLAHQQGRSDDAVALIERSLTLAPDQADWHSNLGIVLQQTGRLERAIDAYRQAIALDAGHANAHSNLGVLLKATGHSSAAEAAYRRAIQLSPDHLDAYTNLGILLGGLGRTEEAAACYCKVITLRPKHPEARKLLALAHGMLGEIDQAARVLEEWLVDEPGNPIALHMMAACSGRDVPARASDDYIERTFDTFAASFESKLERLSYRAPALVATMVESSGFAPAKRLDVLDAGCGTGLCAGFLAPYARRLVGVDISAGMLAQAKDKRVYDALVKAELTDYMREHPDEFDVIAAADALVYFGDLEPVLAAAARRCVRRAFSCSRSSGRAKGAGYHLQVHGRYAHVQEYVEQTLATQGLRAETVHADLRTESGVPVAGLVIRAFKGPDQPPGSQVGQ